MLTATAAEMVETDQPNSSRSGSMRTPGTARNAAAPTRAKKVTAATHQAGWMRWARGGASDVTARQHDRRPTGTTDAGLPDWIEILPIDRTVGRGTAPHTARPGSKR